MIDEIFNWCVHFLASTASQMAITYKAINVWVFVILWPIFTLLLMGIAIAQHLKIRRLHKEAEEIQRQKASIPSSKWQRHDSQRESVEGDYIE